MTQVYVFECPNCSATENVVTGRAADNISKTCSECGDVMKFVGTG